MKATIAAGALAGALRIASKATGRAVSHSHLPYVLLDATPDGGLMLTGTDLRVRASATAEASVEQPGGVCLLPKALDDLLDGSPPDRPVSIALSKRERVTIQAGGTTIRLVGLPPDGYPAATVGTEAAATIEIAGAALRDVVGSVEHAADRGTSKPALAGIHLESVGGMLVATATDTFRLARRGVPIGSEPVLDIVVPHPALVSTTSAIDPAATMRLSVDGEQRRLTLTTDAAVWSMPLIAGDTPYPDVRRVLAVEPVGTLTVERSALLRACRTVIGVMETREWKGSEIAVTLDPGPDALMLRSASGDDLLAEATIEARVDGAPVAMVCSVGYLREAADALGEHVQIQICGALRPAYLRSPGDEHHVQVVMPINPSEARSRR